MNPEEMPYSAFISYASADREKAEEICASLEGHGLKCWIAPRNIRAGHEYADEILQGIQNSRCLVLVLSEAANQSPFVRREVERAVSRRKPVFPIRIEEILPSPSLELFVSATHWIDAWSGQLVDHIDRLASDMSDEQTLQKGAQISTKIARKQGAPFYQSQTAIVSVAAIVVVALLAFFLANRSSSSGSGGHFTTPQYPSAHDMAEMEKNAQASADEQVKTGNAHYLRQRVSSSGTKLKLVSGSESGAPDVYESMQPVTSKLQFIPLCDPDATSIQYGFDDGGYFQQAANQNGGGITPPFSIEDDQGGTRLKLKVTTAAGKETGPYEYEVPDRTTFVLQNLKAEFMALMPQALVCYMVPNSPDSASDNVLRNQLVTLPAHPAVLCIIPVNSPALPWLAVKEIHLASSPGGTPVVGRVKQSWDEFLHSGTSSLGDHGNNVLDAEQFQVELPADAKSVYATFYYQDGTHSDEVRYGVTVLSGDSKPTASAPDSGTQPPAAPAAASAPAPAPAPAPASAPVAAASSSGDPLQQLEAKAAGGDAAAQNQLGMLNEGGSGVPVDYGKAKEWYEKAAAQNNAAAMQSLARLYARGLGMPQNYPTALQYYLKAANLGLSGAQSDLGVMYANGWGTPVDDKQAAVWLQKAADSGEAEAQNLLGKLYLMGTGVPRDVPRAIDLFRKSAGTGNANGENSLGVMYMSGTGVPKDLNTARQFLNQAASQGNTIAQANLLRCK